MHVAQVGFKVFHVAEDLLTAKGAARHQHFARSNIPMYTANVILELLEVTEDESQISIPIIAITALGLALVVAPTIHLVQHVGATIRAIVPAFAQAAEFLEGTGRIMNLVPVLLPYFKGNWRVS